MSLFDDVDVSKLPTKIEKNVLLNATIEVRFDSDIYAEMIVWPLYEKIKDDYEKPQMFPVAQIPREVRKQNPNLDNVVLYAINKEDNTVSIGCGDGVLNITLLNFSYETWDELYGQFKSIFEKLEDTILNINRVSVRYINVIDKEYVYPDNFTFNFIVRDETLLNMPLMSVFEMISPDSGQIRLFGKNWRENRKENLQKVGLVMDGLNQNPRLYCKDLEKIYKRIYKNWDSRLFYQYLERFSLPLNSHGFF